MSAKDLSRRNFLKSAVGAGAVVAGLGLLAGCSNSNEAVAEDTTNFDGEYDIVCIGGGGAGVACAIKAAEQGAKVLILEYNEDITKSGTYLCGGVVMAAGTSAQEEAGITDSPEAMIKYLEACSGGLADDALMETWAKNSAGTVSWLVDHNVEMPSEMLYISGNEVMYEDVTPAVKRGHRTPEMSGETIMEPLYAYTQSLDTIEWKFSTEATNLVVNEEGRVTGVVSTAGTFKANKGVMVASAGFTRNEEWLKFFSPDLFEGLSFGSPRQNGDGIRMGMAIGAKIGYMWAAQSKTIGLWVNDTDSCTMVLGIFKEAVLFVNTDGVRWISEDTFYETICAQIPNLKDGYYWAIWDQGVLGRGIPVGHPIIVSENCEEEVAAGTILKADDIVGLAEQMGIDPDTLENTWNNYNTMMAAGVDTEFGRTTGLGQINEAPYYAAKIYPASCDTAGGLIIDSGARVLDQEDKAIPGLYAGGSTTGGWRGKNYAGSGTAVSVCLTFGLVAADSILADNA